jgi:transcriptional regulator with XRE-family HTH domain
MFKFTKETSNKLRQLRENAFLTQEEVALRVKRSRSFIAQLETGRINDPGINTIINYLKVCGVFCGSFFSELDAMEFNRWHDGIVRKAFLKRPAYLSDEIQKNTLSGGDISILDKKVIKKRTSREGKENSNQEN